MAKQSKDLTWAALNETLKTANEQGVWALLDHEKKHQRRPAFLLRMHARGNRLRAERERRELLK